MADESIFSRIGNAVQSAIIGKAAIPTQTLGSTSGAGYSDAAGDAWSSDRTYNLTGEARYQVYETMMRDTAIVAAGMRLLFSLISNAVWTVNPPEGLNNNEEAVAQGYADIAYDALFSMTTSWSSVVKKTAGYRFHGFSIMEWTAKRRDDGTIGFKDVEHRPQRTIIKWNRDEGGTVESVVQRVGGREVVLPRSKIVYAVDDTLSDSPEGLGLFRHLAVTAQRLNFYIDLEEVAFSTDLRGIPIARAPLAELQEEVEKAGPVGSKERADAEVRRRAMLTPIRALAENHLRNKHTAAVLPSDTFIATTPDKSQTPSTVPKWSLELLNGDASSFADLANTINRLNQELARILGVEHLLLGADGAGSLALARSKVGTFFQIVSSTLLDLVEVFDRDLMEPLAEMNGWPDELRPELGVNNISDLDIEQVTQALANLANAGAPMMPGDPAEGEVYDAIGLTRPDPDRVTLDESLNPNRNDPNKDPNAPDKPMQNNPEDTAVKKVNLLKSRQRRKRRRGRGM